jgi:7,8-dihydroneopterin aldolase/epimerase/oxygenase
MMAGNPSASEFFPDDSIHVEQLELFAYVGVPDDERRAPQRITVTVTAWPTAGLRALGDDISRTINYSAISRAVREVVDERRDKLIETLGEKIADQLLSDFPIRRVRVELRKFVLPGAQFVSVTLTREGGTGVTGA